MPPGSGRLSKRAIIRGSYARVMRRGLGPGTALIFLALLAGRRLVVHGSAHFAHGVLRVLVVLVALIAVAGIRLLVSRR